MNDIPIPTIGNCTCENICPTMPDCTCIWFENLHACVCSCSPTPVPHILKARVAMDSRVNVTSKGTGLGQFARLLSDVCEAEILIPAARMDERFSLNEKYVTLADVARKVGLVVR